MLQDPIHQSQLYLRRAGHRLRGPAPETTRIDGLDDVALQRFYDDGRTIVAMLAKRIEEHAGGELQSRTVLDFGCGVGRMTLPLAERCKYAYGIDSSTAVLREADRNARRMNLANVEWFTADRLAELSGRYDLVVSMYVFQHIPSREGERIFTQLVRGLRPGGGGALHVTVRPGRPLAGLSRWARRSTRFTVNPNDLVRAWDWSYPYHMIHSYSLNRLGRLLADEGVTAWHVRWDAKTNVDLAYETATIIFRKP